MEVFNINLFSTEKDIFHNTKAKYYPDGSVRLTVCNKAVFKEAGYEELTKTYTDKRPVKYDTDKESRVDNLNRTRQKKFDIAFLNNFKYFVTLTLDPEKVSDRYDPKAIKKQLIKWLDNAVQRKNLKYLLIPEHHKDGAIHFHALISADFKFKDSGIKTTDGRTRYNIPEWKYGFSTAVELNGKYENVAKYVTKYITKDCVKIFGNYYFAGGKDLKRDVPCKLFDVDYDSFDVNEYSIPDTNLKFKYPEILKEDL